MTMSIPTRTTSLMNVMTLCPITIDEDASLDQALRMLANYRFRHLPVVRLNEVVGMLSDRDLRLATSLLPIDSRMRDRDGHALPGPKRVREVMRAQVVTLSPDDTAGRASQLMVERQIGAIPLVDDGGLVGIVTETDILRAFLELNRSSRGEADDLVRYHMHRPMMTTTPEVAIDDALDTMDRRIGHLGVLGPAGEDLARRPLVGIVSERDLLGGIAREMIRDARAEAEGRIEDVTMTVDDVMTRDVLTVDPGETLSHCVQAMTGYRVSALPVLEDGRPLGMLTQRDVLEYFAHLF